MHGNAKSTRKRVIAAGVAVVCIQAAAVGMYFWIEQTRREDQRYHFAVEILSGAVPHAADVVLQTPHGTARSLQQSRGKVLLLHFWATWCAPCKRELPHLLELGRALEAEGAFELVAVAVNDDWTSIRPFFSNRVPAAIHLDATGEAAKTFEISALPDTYLLDASGSPVARMAGAREWNTDAAGDTIRSFMRDRRR